VIDPSASVGPRIWNSLPHSIRAGALACCDATPRTVTALLRLHLLATHFGGLSSDQTLFLPPSVEQVVVRKRADSPQGPEQAIKTFRVDLCWAHCPVQSTYGEECTGMYVCMTYSEKRTYACHESVIDHLQHELSL